MRRAIFVITGLLLVTLFYASRNWPGKQVVRSTPIAETGTISSTQSGKTPLPKTFYYPIDRYQDRLTIRNYGKLLTAGDRNNVQCGKAFTGYHTGDDLEIFPNEINSEVPVFAAGSGKVLQEGWISGYGGLIVSEGEIGGKPVTFYYGHLNPNNFRVRKEDYVIAGQVIGSLGAACSNQTDGERKHLHFAIHLGNAIDLRGYVADQTELSNWLPPEDTLNQLAR